ncbi:hypothetical protein C0Q70_04778 [Pomacea canaliculata]|uniref:PNT domain-containing protein n=1 Tax=Pomacea canaliculata TaxID=400727 RepID=A0A2T7PJG2_POMCA|nr:hypothetical protein C0Q70_04778 [Pomacea canaliculata]
MGALATSGIGLHNNYESTMETVLDQLFRNDVQSDCKMLAISPDPMMWSLDDVQRWVRWTCRKYNYRDDCWSLFNVTGEILCRMSEDDFRWRAPEAGNCLYHQLEAWKLGLSRQGVTSAVCRVDLDREDTLTPMLSSTVCVIVIVPDGVSATDRDSREEGGSLCRVLDLRTLNARLSEHSPRLSIPSTFF